MHRIDAQTEPDFIHRRGSRMLMALVLCWVGVGCDSGDSAVTSDRTSGAAAAAQVSGFSGTFHASIDGEQSVLTLQQAGTALNGTADGYKISGTVDGQNATFNLVEPASGQVFATGTIQRQGQQLELVLTVTHPQTGQKVQAPAVRYSPSGAGAAETQTATAAPGGGGPIDERIVGRWRHTWARADPVSGLSIAVDDWLILNADGTCQYGSSRAAGGTADISIDTGPTQLSRGVWRAEEKTLLVGSGGGDWSNWGTYLCDGQRLLLKSGGGNTIYERQ
jgi:hypothetical protein